MRLGTTEIILILVLVVVLFGGGKIAGLGKALGTSIRDFKQTMRDDKEEVEAKEAERQAADNFKNASVADEPQNAHEKNT